MSYTLDEIKEKVFDRVYAVYDLFKECFGEDSVDLQDLPDLECRLNNYLQDDGRYNVSDEGIDIVRDRCKAAAPSVIMVWWPMVRVTNEYDKSIIIYDLYAKVVINTEGEIPYEYNGFTLNRSRYSYEQWVSDYMHSHIPGIPKDNLSRFCNPCLGTGPIRHTIESLKNDFDETMWRLFCQELSLYVTIESIRGVPYRRLENVGIVNNYPDYSYMYPKYEEDNYRPWIDSRQFRVSEYFEFIKFYLKEGNLSFAFQNGTYTCTIPWYNYLLDVSNAFIKFYNHSGKTNKNALFFRRVIYKRYVLNKKIYNDANSSLVDTSSYIGTPVCTFKGEIKRLVIDNQDNHTTAVPVTLVHPAMAADILMKILKVINYNYGKNEVTTVNKGVRYI